MKIIDRAIDWYQNRQADKATARLGEILSVDNLDPFALHGMVSNSVYDGEKFADGFGVTNIFQLDYWTLRMRSAQLFTENLYAGGLIKRLVTNEINTGLMPEACPDEQILGLPADSLNEWTEMVESRFDIWGKNPRICDWFHDSNWGALQRAARMEALICGDVLVVVRQSSVTKLPTVQLISGSAVQTTLDAKARPGNRIRYGVEYDSLKRVVAYWVRQTDGRSKRLPVYGEKSGRRIAWLVFGGPKRLDDVRGQPLLSVVLQSLKEIDRYRDSTQRKAVVNSIIALFIEKTEDKMSTLPVTGSAVRKDAVETSNNDGTTQTRNLTKHLPGVALEELQTGEKPHLLGGQGTDTNFGEFEEAIIQAVAWSNEIPPEILRLAFSNNYSASQAAINEFKIYLNKVWGEFGAKFCTPIYIEWLISETLLQKFKAPGLLQAWRDPTMYDIFGAWVSVDWYGAIKPSTDMLKQVKGSELLVAGGYSTRAREARITTGTKFDKNVKRLKRENTLLAEAARPMLELEKEFGPQETTKAVAAVENAAESIVNLVEEAQQSG